MSDIIQNTMTTTITDLNLPLPLFRKGKVRHVYDLGSTLLLVATDRISAFDCILPNGIPFKGEVLTQISKFWFNQLQDIVPNHLISADIHDFPEEIQLYRETLENRTMWVKKTQRIDVECVARGYLAGSGWKDYQQTGAVCGISLPPGLQLADKLPEPIFTPASKADEGHDENVSFDHLVQQLGWTLADRLRSLTLALYSKAHTYARSKGILLADTKFEFGLLNGQVILIDEALTPDSSRFWELETYQPGISPPSYDKQIIRDYLETCGWDKHPPAPSLPPATIQKTSQKYQEIYRRLTQ